METLENVNKEKRKDLFMVDPRLIQVDETFNVRQEYGDINELKNSIITNGVKVALRGHRDGGGFKLTDGFRRMRAITMALAEGHDIPLVPFLLESRDYTDTDRIIDMFIMNSGKNLEPLEEAEGIKRLLNTGLKPKEIATRIGKTQAHISNMVLIMESPEFVKSKIRERVITATTALNIIRETSDPSEQQSIIEKGMETAQKNGNKKVTTRSLTNVSKGKSGMQLLKEAYALFEESHGIADERVMFFNKLISKLDKKVEASNIVTHMEKIKLS